MNFYGKLACRVSLGIAFVVLILVTGCVYGPNEEENETPADTTAAPAVTTLELPNPASKFCIDQGYNLTIRTNPDGSQTGYCIFPDGKECEEWAYFRGECKNE